MSPSKPSTPRRSFLRASLMLSLLVAGVVLSFAIALLHRYNIAEVLQVQAEIRAQSKLRLLRSAAEMSHEPEEIQRLVSAAGAERDVLGIALTRGEPQRVVVASHSGWVGLPVEGLPNLGFRELLPAVAGKAHFTEMTRVAPDLSRTAVVGNYLVHGARGRASGRELGLILLAYDDGGARATLAQATRLAFGRACVLTFTLVVLAYLLVKRRVLMPLEAISGVLAARAHADLKARVPHDLVGTDEIGRVGASLNSSFDDIAELNAARDQHEEDMAEIMLALKHVDERLNFMLGEISAMVYAGKPDGRGTTFVSANAPRVTGYTPQDFLADPELWSQRLHPHDAPRVLEALRTRPPGGTIRVEYRFRHRDGHYLWMHDDSRPAPATEGRPAEIIGFMVDISARKDTERRLRESELQFEALIEALPQWAWTIKPTGALEIIGDKAATYLGQPPHRLQNDEWRDFVHPEDRAKALEKMRDARDRGKPFSVDFRLRRADGIYRWFNAAGAPVRDDEGTLTHWVGYAIDITERRNAEEQLRESQKMEAIGQLTGGLAHDFNNLLGVVVGNLDMLADELPDDERARRHHQTALDAALRGAEVTMSLLAVARRQPMEISAHDVSELIREMLPLLRASAGSGIQVLTQFTPGNLFARLDARGLSNVALNLVINARDAMENQQGEKRILIRVRHTVVKPESTLALRAGAYVVLEVTDSGPGMSTQVRAQAFEPFFTTKARDRGTGLGLAMVHGYAEQLGGTARIESVEGEGATIRVYLPVDAAHEAEEEREEQKRIEALRALRMLDSPPEIAFDALVMEAARVCGTAIAVISLVDEHRQWFKSRLGLQVDETPREDAFCAHAIRTPGEVMIVNDAAADPRFAANPLVLNEPKIRFYAGVPLVDERGRGMGTLCVIDRVPLSLSDGQRQALQDLADEISLMMRLKAPVRDRASRESSTLAEAANVPLEATGVHVRILVVDDEPGMCELACHWLQTLGYETVPALGADQALIELEAHRFEVLFTDVVMPGTMDGVSLARAARRRQPHLKLLFASGYARNLAAEIEKLGPLLSKPYRKHHLQEAMKHLVDQEALPA